MASNWKAFKPLENQLETSNEEDLNTIEQEMDQNPEDIQSGNESWTTEAPPN
jgi:hypothetical protein